MVKLDSGSSICVPLLSGVDLRSSKVCELGLLNHKSKHVFHPFERSKYHCRFDYYWASVFKVMLLYKMANSFILLNLEASFNI